MNKLIKTYLGFSIKSRAIVIGQDRLKQTKDNVYLLVYCDTASTNLKDLVKRLGERFKCEVLCLDEKLEDYTSIKGCKALGVTNKSLADNIIKVANGKGEVNGK